MGSITKGGRSYFCKKHEDWATPNEAVCKGSKVRDGPKCYRCVPDPNYPFCSTKHDQRAKYCDPNLFREDGLRGRVLSTLRKRAGDHDHYNPGTMILGNAEDFDVDHSFEIQQFSYCWQLGIFQNDEEKNDVTRVVRDEFVNTLSNLVVTWAPTNLGKGRAVTNVLEDLMKYSLVKYDRPDVRSLKDIRTASFNAPIVATLDDQLIKQGLGRNSTRAIRRRMGQSLRCWQYKCLNQGETPIYDVLGGIANEIFTAFDLHTDTNLE
ncbi:hypothetical protein PC121_g18182 [Phytophthora cactorum]|nr:hypothetical protein PC120_g21991 [Phytophthora cactorum]KAG3050814.1 hypothetical protein PC121_g18182 [Phytophthora cactorum]